MVCVRLSLRRLFFGRPSPGPNLFTPSPQNILLLRPVRTLGYNDTYTKSKSSTSAPTELARLTFKGFPELIRCYTEVRKIVQKKSQHFSLAASRDFLKVRWF